MSKARPQSRARSIKRNNTDIMGNSLRRPYNNRKRTIGREDQVKAESFYKYLKKRLEEYKLNNEINESEDSN